MASVRRGTMGSAQALTGASRLPGRSIRCNMLEDVGVVWMGITPASTARHTHGSWTAPGTCVCAWAAAQLAVADCVQGPTGEEREDARCGGRDVGPLGRQGGRVAGVVQGGHRVGIVARLQDTVGGSVADLVGPADSRPPGAPFPQKMQACREAHTWPSQLVMLICALAADASSARAAQAAVFVPPSIALAAL